MNNLNICADQSSCFISSKLTGPQQGATTSHCRFYAAHLTTDHVRKQLHHFIEKEPVKEKAARKKTKKAPAKRRQQKKQYQKLKQWESRKRRVVIPNKEFLRNLRLLDRLPTTSIKRFPKLPPSCLWPAPSAVEPNGLLLNIPMVLV